MSEVPHRSLDQQIRQAECWNRELVNRHYENFSVGSIFLPKLMRQDIYNIYAFCRLADDFADEASGGGSRSGQLDLWESLLEGCAGWATGNSGPDIGSVAQQRLFLALGATITKHKLPLEPFLDLLTAFRLDLTKTSYETSDELTDYARLSANPVGRLVLLCSGVSDEALFALSDKICTALQLANHWQDVAEDYQRGRVYIPQEVLHRFDVTEADIASGCESDGFLRLMESLVNSTEETFVEGKPLLTLAPASLRPQLYLYWGGGMAAIGSIRRNGYRVLSRKCSVSGRDRAALAIGALGRLAFSKFAN